MAGMVTEIPTIVSMIVSEKRVSLLIYGSPTLLTRRVGLHLSNRALFDALIPGIFGMVLSPGRKRQTCICTTS